ncbi:MAG: right-handed parallel beta-helix repeat-containing protein, partial [Bacteroidales bacterium]
GNLSIGQVQENVQIGTYNFTGNPVEVTILQYLPNGIDDSNPYNDSIVKTVRPSLCGEYTIGGNNPDFTNFNQAANVLNIAGISCPVVFKVRNGDYNEQFILEDIQGSSAQNTITFESESGDSTGVIIRCEVWSLTTVLLRKTRYIHFKEIGFRGAYVAMQQSNTYQIDLENCYLSGYYSLLLDDISNNIHVNNCLTQGVDYNIGIRSGSHDINISNSQINGGTWGIVVQNGLQQYANVTITDNVFTGQYYASINTSGTRGVVVDRNVISATSTGIYADNTYNIIITNNIINTISGSYWHNSGIHFENTTDSVNIYNNFIHTYGSFRSDGIFLQNSNHTNVYFNSINITNNEISRSSKGLCIMGGDQNDIRNNISSIEYWGYPAYLAGSFSNLTMDYNDFYHPEGLIGQINATDIYSLSEWQSASGNDMHSFAENPFFTTSTDLSINQALLNNSGTPISEIPNDIDSNPRNILNPDIGAREYQACIADAGINKITEPDSPVSSGQHEVKVILQNQGTSSLNSAIIQWEVNGITQPQFLWSGNLAEKANTELSIGLFNFVGGLSTIRAWTELPNGITDCNHLNDTSIRTLTGSLCGEYTIGGQNPDFSTFTEAAMVLNTAGISCPVVFKVRNGDYYEQIILDAIPGSSAQNSITFESESGDSTAVMLRYEVWPSITLQIKNTQNIRFKEIGIRGNHFAIQLSKVTDFQMDNCFISSGYYNLALDDTTNQVEISHSYLQASDWALGIRSGSKDIQVHDCIFYGANYGIVIQSGPQIFANITISNNEFTQQGNASINIASARDITITDNTFTTNRTGIYSDNSKNLLISGNRIHIFAQADWYNSGIHFETLTDSVNIFNNFILTSGIYKSEGIFLQNSSRSKVYYNSINITNNDVAGDSKGIYINGGEQIDFQNNILRISKLGFPIYLSGTSINLTTDYNDFYHPELLIGHNNTTNYYSLADWKFATDQDDHSYAVDPYFTSNMDLSVNQSILNNVGIPIPEIQYDIDGSVRNNTHPDIGAKEFSTCETDAGINQISSPSSPLSDGSQSIKVILQNQGTNILFSAIIHWKVNGQSQTPFNWNGNLIEKANTEVTIGNFNFTDGLFNIKAWTSLPNGNTDCNNINDTISKKVSTTLCGEYTIGGNSPDFQTFTDAVKALNQSGISCPVTFNIRDGEYIERFLFKDIQGSSAINTITFQSESSDSSAVIIRFSDYSTSTIQLYKAKYINVNKISIQGYWGLMVDNSEYININNCYITNGLWTRTNSQFIKIENCYFTNGISIESGSKHIDIASNELIGGGISVGNDWSNYVQDIEILNNNFTLGASISSTYSKGVTIKNNDFISNQSGLRFYSSNNLTITENFFNIYQT